MCCLERIKTNNSNCSLESRHDHLHCAVFATPVVLACVQFCLQSFQSPCGQLQLENGQWKTQKEVISKFLNVCCSEQGYEILHCMPSSVGVWTWVFIRMWRSVSIWQDRADSKGLPSSLHRLDCYQLCAEVPKTDGVTGHTWMPAGTPAPPLLLLRIPGATCLPTALGNISQVALASFLRVIKCENSFCLPVSFQNSRKKKS